MSGAALAGFQKRYLRGLAHGLRPVAHVGKEGLTDSVLEAISGQLAAHELIKVRLREPEDKKGLAEEIAGRVGGHLVTLVGHVAVIYRPSRRAEGARIRLPERSERENPEP